MTNSPVLNPPLGYVATPRLGYPLQDGRWAARDPQAPSFITTPFIQTPGPYYTGMTVVVGFVADGWPPPMAPKQWYRDPSTALAGEVQVSYVIGAGEAGNTVSCGVALTNTEGSVPETRSNSTTTIIQSVLPAQTTPPVIGPAGSQPSGTVLTYDIPGVWTGPPGSGEPGFNVTFDWYRDGTIIGGTTGQTSYDTAGQPDGAYTVRERGANYAGGPVLGAPSNEIEVGTQPQPPWQNGDTFDEGGPTTTYNHSIDEGSPSQTYAHSFDEGAPA